MKMCRNSFPLDSIFGIGTPAHASSTNIGLQQRCRSLSSDGTVGCGRGSCRRLGIVCVETFSRWDKGISFVNVIDPLQVFTRAAFVKAKTAVVSCKTFFWSIGARGMSLGMSLWEEGKACTWEAPSHRVPSSASALLIFLPSSVTIIALGVLSSQQNHSFEDSSGFRCRLWGFGCSGGFFAFNVLQAESLSLRECAKAPMLSFTHESSQSEEWSFMNARRSSWRM